MNRVLILAALLWSSAAVAADCPEETRASATYEEGAKALAEGRYNDAARKFAQADRLCPHDIALGEAFRAVEMADNPILCMELVERAKQRNTLPVRRRQLERMCGTKVGKLIVRCPGTTCEASIDGRPTKLHEPVWVLTGDHIVDLRIDGGPVRPEPVTVRPGETLTVPPERAMGPPVPRPGLAPPATPTPEPGRVAEDRGIHPAAFYVGLGLTVVSSGLLIWSGVDTIALNDDFKATSDPNLLEDGMDAQLRTNALIGVTAGLGVATVVVALFTDWSSEPSPVTIEGDGQTGLVTWRGRF